MSTWQANLFASLLIGSTSFGLVSIAHAKDVHIKNASNHIFSVKVKDRCSPEIGNIAPQTTKAIQQTTLAKPELCGDSKWDICKLYLYSEANCGGNTFGTAHLNRKIGFIYAESDSGAVKIGGFDLTVEMPNG